MEGMMDGSMMGGTMMFCMMASALFGLIITVAVIVQAVLQTKILDELRKLNATVDGSGVREQGPVKTTSPR
jgi:hypothetical protein